MTDVRHPYLQWTYPYPWLVFYAAHIPGPIRCTYCRTSMHPRQGLPPWAPQIGQHSASHLSRHLHASICHPPPPNTTPTPTPAVSISISLHPSFQIHIQGAGPTREPVDIPVHLATLYHPYVGVPLYIGRESDGWLVHSFHWDFADFNDFDDPSDTIVEGRWRVWDPDFVHPGLSPQPQPSSATEAGWRLVHSHGSHHWVREQPLVYQFPPRDGDGDAVERGGSQPYRFPTLANDPLDRSGADDIPRPNREDYAVSPLSGPRPAPNPGSPHDPRSGDRRAAGAAALGIDRPRSLSRWRPAYDTPGHSGGQAGTDESFHTAGQAISSRPPARPAAPGPPPLAPANSNTTLPSIAPVATRSSVLSAMAASFRPASSRPVDLKRSAKQTSAVSAVTERSVQSGSVGESSMSCSSQRLRHTVDQHFNNSSLWKRRDRRRRRTRSLPGGTYTTQKGLSVLADEMAIINSRHRVLTRSVSEPLRLGNESDDRLSANTPPRPPVHTPREHQPSSAGHTALSLSTEISFASNKPEPTREESASLRGRTSTGRGRRAVSSPAGFPRTGPMAREWKRGLVIDWLGARLVCCAL